MSPLVVCRQYLQINLISGADRVAVICHESFVRALVAFTKAMIPYDFAKKSDDYISFIKYIFHSKCELIYHLLWFALT